jgi:hypothetical protein
MQQQQKKGFDPSMKDSFNIAYFVMTAQAACITPFTRASFGSEALGFPGIGAFVGLCIWLLGTEAVELQAYMLLWCVAIVVQRIKTIVDGARGNYQHSGYAGYPITGLICRHEMFAKLMEGAFIVAGGFALEEMSWAISHVLMASGGCIIALETIHRQYHKKQEEARRDAMIEMQAWNDPTR